MAKQLASTSRPATGLNPKDALASVAGVLTGSIEDIIIEFPWITTTADALKKVNDTLTESDRHRSVVITKARTREQTLRLQRLAKEASSFSSSSLPLQIRNSIPSSEIEMPKRPTPAQIQRLKEKFFPSQPQNDPYIIVRANLDEGKLASISGAIVITAIDAAPPDLQIQLRSDHCVWDTGAHISRISEDLIRGPYPDFLDNDIHAIYRQADGVSVKVAGRFKFSNFVLDISTIFQVTPLDRIPNRRSGIILGQTGFIDQMLYESIPRKILEKRGKSVEDSECVEDSEWGDINIKAYVNDDDEIVDLA
ncbi:MAG: hypothetical protein Q9167_007968 [Letrouitia subvulpina]